MLKRKAGCLVQSSKMCIVWRKKEEHASKMTYMMLRPSPCRDGLRCILLQQEKGPQRWKTAKQALFWGLFFRKRWFLVKRSTQGCRSCALCKESTSCSALVLGSTSLGGPQMWEGKIKPSPSAKRWTMCPSPLEREFMHLLKFHQRWWTGDGELGKVCAWRISEGFGEVLGDAWAVLGQRGLD